MASNQLVKYLGDIFPDVEIDENDNDYVTIVIEDYYVPELLKALRCPNKNKCLLTGFFAFLESILQENFSEYSSIVQVTILESIGNNSSILKNALRFMGPLTVNLQQNAESCIGRENNLKLLEHADNVNIENDDNGSIF